jgi:hypothetical protein
MVPESTIEPQASGPSLMSFDTPKSGEEQWYGHLPCVCESHQGCHQHNPMMTAIYRNPLLPPRSQKNVEGMTSKSTQSQSSSIACEEFPKLPEYTETRPEWSPVFTVRLPFDCQSVRTLTPSHPNMPHHLAFYHLHCIRRQLGPNVRKAFITELSCKGVFNHNELVYAWSSEVYFDRTTFLQKQEVNCVMRQGSRPQEITLTSCPHHDLRIEEPIFKNMDGFTDVEITHWGYDRQRRSRRRVQTFGNWSGSQGLYHGAEVCSICYADAEYTFECVNDQLYVRFVCYKDLGPGNDRNSPKWLSLFTGVGYPSRANYLNVAVRVQWLAEDLGPNKRRRACEARTVSRRASSSSWVAEGEYN